MLCEVCINVLKRYENEYESEMLEKSLGHHREPASVHSSAVLGCYVCTSLWHALSDIPLSQRDAEFYKKEETRAREGNTTPSNDDTGQSNGKGFFTHACLTRTTWPNDEERSDEVTLDFKVGIETTIGLGSFWLEKLQGS